jgi:uncharacterized membrane-anchored protein
MRILLALGSLCFALGSGLAWAQSDAIRSEPSAALRDAQLAATVGPAEIDLPAGHAKLELPQDHLFVPMPAAARLLRAMGNTPDPHLVGVIYPPRQENWMMAIQYEDSGHILDDDARDWDVDQLLRSVADGTEQGNEERRRFGFPEIQVLGWAEKPRYDTVNHRLVWAVAAREKGAPPTGDQGVNYNTYVLGRDGYFKLNFVTDLKDLHAQIPAADSLVASLQYNEGKAYADFNKATDKAANFGVAALVAGFAARKVGAPSESVFDLAIRWGMWVVVALVIISIAYFAWRWWQARPKKQPITVRDDFPPTEISTVSMDQPTVPMYAHPAAGSGAALEGVAGVRPSGVPAMGAPLGAAPGAPMAPALPIAAAPSAPPGALVASMREPPPLVPAPVPIAAPVEAGAAANTASHPPAAAPSPPKGATAASIAQALTAAGVPLEPVPEPPPAPVGTPPPAPSILSSGSVPLAPATAPAPIEGAPLIPAAYVAPPAVVEEGPEPDLGFPPVFPS